MMSRQVLLLLLLLSVCNMQSVYAAEVIAESNALAD